MYYIKHYFNHVHQHFGRWFYASRQEQAFVSQATFIALLSFAGLVFGLAALGYVLADYHWGFQSINALSSQLSPVLLHHMTSFGDGIFILSMLLYIANRNVPLLLAVLIGSLIGAIVSQTLKRYFNADRPPAALELDAFNLIGKAYYSRSFPSGHTLTAFLVASVLICFSRSAMVKWCIAGVAVSAGLSRILLGVHWPIDVLVGSGLGTLIGVVAVKLSQRWSAGIHLGYIVFTLALLALACIIALVEPNDYGYAQLMISLVAILALWRTYSHYFSPSRLGLFNGLTASSPQTRYAWLFFGLLLLITLYRICVLAQAHVSLFYDEAYYYHWSLLPDLGYYSKPPMVAWFIAVCTQLLGDSVFTVKLAAPLLYSATSVVIFATVKRISNTEAAAVAGLIFATSTVVGFNSLFITTDAPMLFFWALALYFFMRAVAENRLILWIGLGVATGLGMLSKFTMALLPVSLFAFLLLSKPYRPRLANYKPWLAAVIAGCFFALNLYWNSQHEWIAFTHTKEISKQSEGGFHLLALLEFLAGQIFVLGPVWIALGFIAIKNKLNTDTNQHYGFAPKALVYALLGILLVICFQALTSRAFVNWAAPWIIAASMLLGLSVTFSNGYGKWIRNGCMAHLLLLSAFYHWPIMLQHLQIEPTRKNNPYQRLAGWEAVSAQLQPILAATPDAYLASDSRDLLAYLGFHAMTGSTQFARWNPDASNVRDHYDLKYNLREHRGNKLNYVFVAKTPLPPTTLAQFDQAQFVTTIKHQVFSDMVREVYVYRLQGFNGYE